MSEPRLMAVRTAPRATPLLETLVVTLHDGRPGFSARLGDVRQLDGAPVLLHPEDGAADASQPTYEGVARVLRSGAAYDEVLGRTREAQRWWSRGTRRAGSAVVVVEVAVAQANSC
jgi:hypothetical protein